MLIFVVFVLASDPLTLFRVEILLKHGSFQLLLQISTIWQARMSICNGLLQMPTISTLVFHPNGGLLRICRMSHSPFAISVLTQMKIISKISASTRSTCLLLRGGIAESRKAGFDEPTVVMNCDKYFYAIESATFSTVELNLPITCSRIHVASTVFEECNKAVTKRKRK